MEERRDVGINSGEWAVGVKEIKVGRTGTVKKGVEVTEVNILPLLLLIIRMEILIPLLLSGS